MNRRVRRIAASIAMVPLLALSVGAAWATASCDGAMDTAPAADSAAALHAHGGPQGDAGEDAEPPAGCPALPIGPAACSLSVPLPITPDLAPRPQVAEASAIVPPPGLSELLLSTSLLRPPQP